MFIQSLNSQLTDQNLGENVKTLTVDAAAQALVRIIRDVAMTGQARDFAHACIDFLVNAEPPKKDVPDPQETADAAKA